MSFQNNIWLPNGSGSAANEEIYNDNLNSTRIHQKRPLFMGPSEPELFLNKKQAVESAKEPSAPAVMVNSVWHDGSIFQTEGSTPSLYCPKPIQGLNLSDKDLAPIISSSKITSIEKKSFENQFTNDPSICLTMSSSVENHLPLNTGHRKVKVNEVRISENCMPGFVDNSEVMRSSFQTAGNYMFPGPKYNSAEGTNISIDPASSKIGSHFVLTNEYYDGMDNNVLSIGPAFNQGNYNINSVGEQYEKEIGNFTSICTPYSRAHDNFLTMDPFYGKVNETFVTGGPNKGNTNIAFCSQQQDTENSSILTVENSKKGEETTISFGGFQNNAEERDHSGRLISSYDFLLNRSSEALGQKDSGTNISASSSKEDRLSKNGDQKVNKGSSNNFPTNVKSLLSTGVLDEVPVKYVSWSREKNLRGVVKGTGYLCSCKDCKLSKIINAYEFERHAGCKTKHPNNHIYFENGKTIYAVVQELKNTPKEMLFDTMLNVTGSKVNQKNFNAWKASYQAATLELQRIYSKDDVVVQS